MPYGIPDDVREGARHAGKEARKKFLANHPEPLTMDFECSTCGVTIGERCKVRLTRFDRLFGEHHERYPGTEPVAHKARQDKCSRAFNQWQFNAVQAEDDAFNKYIEEWEKTRVCCDHSESCSHVWCDECGSWSKDIGGMSTWDDGVPESWYYIPKGAAVLDCTHPRDYHYGGNSYWYKNTQVLNKEDD